MAEPEEPNAPTTAGHGDAVGLRTGRRQDFTHRRLDGLRVDGLDLRQSLFIGTLIENCVFSHVDFSRCDLSGTKIVRCDFEECRFALADIRSCRFDETRLLRCDLGTSQIARTDCRQTTFASCRFEEGTLLESTLTECNVDGCSFAGASVTSVDFDRCAFADTGLADCTALFLFFHGCRFERFSINAESIGFTYGLDRLELEGFRLVHLGYGQDRPPGSDLIDLLAATYRSRRWFVGAATLDLNFELTPTVVAVRRLADDLADLARHGMPGDLDEMEFFVRVLERLERLGRLPLLAVRMFGRALRDLAATSSSRSDDRSSRLVARMDALTFSMLDEACRLLPVGATDLALTIEFTLSEKPPLPLDALCRDVLDAVHGSDAPFDFASGREGSWIEVWQTTSSVLATVQLVLLSVNGMLFQLNKMVENGRRLGKTVRRGKAPRTGKTVAKRSDLAGMVGLEGDDGFAAQISSNRRRASLLSDEALRRVDVTLDAVAAKPDRDLAGLHAYSAQRILAVEVAPAKTPRRTPRRRPPAS